MAQLVKNPPAMWETWVRSLGWEDPLKKGRATHSSILAWRICGVELYSPWGPKQLGKTERLSLSLFTFMVSPIVVYRCESWIIKKAEYQRTDASFFFFELMLPEEKALESPLDRKEMKPVNPKGNQP